MTFEEWADQNINNNQSAYTAAKAAWEMALLVADNNCELIERKFDLNGNSEKAYGAWECKMKIRSIRTV